MSPEFASLLHIRSSFLNSILLLPGIFANSAKGALPWDVILILYLSLKSLPFSAKALIVGPVVIYSGAKDKAAFLKEE